MNEVTVNPSPAGHKSGYHEGIMALLRANAEVRVGQYLLGERLGAGGMAEVFIAHGAEGGIAGRRFAIKRILPQLAKDPRFVAMFCDEGRICSALQHPNIVRVVDFGEQDGDLFMAMEYVDGISCARLLRAIAARGRHVPVPVACFMAREVLEALAFAHEAKDEQGRPLRIVHRDVSPGNILVSKRGEVKLGDFGIVRSEFIARRTYPGELKGKIGYMSPEQVVGADVDPRSDLFAIGIVLAELLLTRPLFPGKSEMEVLTRIYEADLRVLDHHAEALPPRLVELLRWTLKRRVQERPKTARELASALDDFLHTQSSVVDSAGLVAWLMAEELLSAQSGVRAATPSPEAQRAARPPSSARMATSDASSLTPRSTLPVKGRPRTLYRVRLPNGEVLGPMGPVELVDGFATRRFSLDVVVVKNEERPRPARVLGELRSIVAVEDWIDQVMASRHLVRVGLDRTRLPSFLYGIVQRNETGVLLLKDGSRRLAITFSDGAPVGAMSSDRDLLLGARLLEEGLLDTERLSSAMEMLVEAPSLPTLGSGRLGDLLIDQRWIEPSELLRVLVAQLESRFLGLGKWEAGEVCFVSGNEYVRGQLKTVTQPLHLVTRAIRQGFPGRELARILSSLGDNPIAQNPCAASQPEDLGLLADEVEALARVIGTRSLGRFLAESVARQGPKPDDILRAVFVGMSAGVLVSPGWPWR
jgi:eukaryotic-like serine/threonine-protein kinase